jgi:RNA polymerase sigma factor FliA
LMQKKNEEPTEEDIAKEAGLNKTEVGETLSQLAYSEIISFEEDIGEDLKLHETVRARDPGPEAQLIEQEARNVLKEAIDSLNEREKKVLSLYYNDELKLKEIGYILEISEGRVCQIMQKTMGKLRTYIEKQIKN